MTGSICSSQEPISLVNIPKVGVLLIRQILECVRHVLVLGLGRPSCSQGVALLVLILQIEPKSNDHNDEQTVAAEMRGKGDEVPGLVPIEENLGPYFDPELAAAADAMSKSTYRWRCRWPR